MRAIKARKAPLEAKALEVFAGTHRLDYYDLREVSVRGRIEGHAVEMSLNESCLPGYVTDTLQLILGLLHHMLGHHFLKTQVANGPTLHVAVEMRGSLPPGLRLIREDYSSGVSRLNGGDSTKLPELHIEVDEPDTNGDGVLAYLTPERRDSLSKLLANGTGQLRGNTFRYACNAPPDAQAVDRKVAELVSLVRALGPAQTSISAPGEAQP
ncbi:MAG: hypothetical protein HY901_12985 [Deltaproteobacteria bacterium]|nr:hypothetical protein [Deltaproteobacteria bacterium]